MSRPVCFLDSSAITKLVVQETESDALADRLAGCDLVGSALVLTEVPRAVRRVLGHDRDELLGQVLDLIHLVAINRSILLSAADLRAPGLRTLEAIHLASAISLAPRLDAFIAYDDRLLAAAGQAALTAEKPGH